VLRALRLGSIRIHTVTGPVSAHLGAIGVDDAITGFETIAAGAISSAIADTSHRWRAEQA
jgi:putative membrane protein